MRKITNMKFGKMFDITYWSMSKLDRMFIYFYYHDDKPGETKMGQKYVPAGECPIKQVLKRTREQLGTKKIYAGEHTIENIIDVTTFSKKYDVFSKKAKADDRLYKEMSKAGYPTNRIQTNAEFYNNNALDLYNYACEFLHNDKTSVRYPLSLTTEQARGIMWTKNQFITGEETILLDLCPRYGKTLMILALAVELDIDVLNILSYVNTVNPSFFNEAKKYSQFAHFTYVSVHEKDWKRKVADCVENNQKVIIYSGLHKSNNLKRNIDFISNLGNNSLTVVDEADFGSWTLQQCTIVQNVFANLKLILMSGTNPEKSRYFYKNIDNAKYVSYFRLLKSKKIKEEVELKYFKVDKKLDDKYVGIKNWKMNLNPLLEKLQGILGPEYLPTWTKVCLEPIENKIFWKTIVSGMFLGEGNLFGINIDKVPSPFGKTQKRVSMIFMSATNEGLHDITDIFKYVLGDEYKVIGLCGDMKTNNGETITQENAERYVKQELKNNDNKKPIIIISNIMAQRSFSISEICDVIDTCQEFSLQKAARGLTVDFQNNNKKFSNIIDLSFSSSKLGGMGKMVIDDAYKEGGADKLRENASELFNTIDFNEITSEGTRVSLEFKDPGIQDELFSENNICRLTGALISRELVKSLPDDILDIFASGNSVFEFIENVTDDGTFLCGETYKKSKTDEVDTITKEKDDSIQKAINNIKFICSHLDILRSVSNTNNVYGIIKFFDENKAFQENILEYYGFNWEAIKYLLENNIINTAILNLRYDYEK